MLKYEPLFAAQYRPLLEAHSAPRKQTLEQLVGRQAREKEVKKCHSQNKPDRDKGIGCTSSVTVDRVRATDEWVQEAVMSDIFHQTRKTDKKK